MSDYPQKGRQSVLLPYVISNTSTLTRSSDFDAQDDLITEGNPHGADGCSSTTNWEIPAGLWRDRPDGQTNRKRAAKGKAVVDLMRLSDRYVPAVICKSKNMLWPMRFPLRAGARWSEGPLLITGVK
jgi:hypothetical protein